MDSPSGDRRNITGRSTDLNLYILHGLPDSFSVGHFGACKIEGANLAWNCLPITSGWIGPYRKHISCDTETGHSRKRSYLLPVHEDDVIPRYLNDVVFCFELKPPRITLVSYQRLDRICRDAIVKGDSESGGVRLLDVSDSCEELVDDGLLGGVTHHPTLRQLWRRSAGLSARLE